MKKKKKKKRKRDGIVVKIYIDEIDFNRMMEDVEEDDCGDKIIGFSKLCNHLDYEGYGTSVEAGVMEELERRGIDIDEQR